MHDWDLGFELLIAAKLAVAFLLGAFIGYDRERSGHSAGIRTYAAVAMGSALFAMLADLTGDATNEARIIASIVQGVGFLGAGIIFQHRERMEAQGLTTAATVWATSGVGVAVGLELFVIAALASGALYFLLSMQRFKWYVRWMKRVQVEGRKKGGDDGPDDPTGDGA